MQAASASSAAANTTEPVVYEEVTKTRRKTVRMPLAVAGPGLVMPGMSPEQLRVRRLANSLPKVP